MWAAVVGAAWAAAAGGADGCFVKTCFDPTAVRVLKNLTYGAAFDQVQKRVVTLTLDAYLPPASDTRPLRPAAVLVHGGSFVSGNDRSDSEPRLALELVTRGYVAVSINYRLDGAIGLESDVPGEDAADDAKAAIRFVRKMSTEWQVDPARVMIGGDSAGAVTSLLVGYATAGRHGESGNPGFNDSVQAVVSVSGELKSQAFCSKIDPVPSGCALDVPHKDWTNNITGPPQPPLLMLHGTADTTIPYVNGLECYTRARAMGLPAEMLTVPQGGHVPFDQLFNNATRLDQFMTFLSTKFAGNATCAC